MSILRILSSALMLAALRKYYKQVIFAILLFTCTYASASTSKVVESVEVTATKVISNNFYEKYIVVGKSRAQNSKTYYAKVEGTVDTVAATLGLEVNKDDIILTIDSEIAEALKAKADAAYESAKSTYDRDASLGEKKILSKEALDKSRVALQTAKADLATINDKYQNMIIRAPFDGLVGAITTYVGNNTKMGDYLFTIIASGGKVINVELPESLSGKIDSNSEVSVYDTAGNKVKGHIDAVSDYLNDNGTISANITFPESTKILHGSYVEIEIIYDHHMGLGADEKAVLKNNKGNFIYKILPDNKLKQIYVTLKTRYDNLIEIFSEDINDGDLIVLAGLTKVHDGTSVSVVEPSITENK